MKNRIQQNIFLCNSWNQCIWSDKAKRIVKFFFVQQNLSLKIVKYLENNGVHCSSLSGFLLKSDVKLIMVLLLSFLQPIQITIQSGGR